MCLFGFEFARSIVNAIGAHLKFVFVFCVFIERKKNHTLFRPPPSTSQCALTIIFNIVCGLLEARGGWMDGALYTVCIMQACARSTYEHVVQKLRHIRVCELVVQHVSIPSQGHENMTCEMISGVCCKCDSNNNIRTKTHIIVDIKYNLKQIDHLL